MKKNKIRKSFLPRSETAGGELVCFFHRGLFGGSCDCYRCNYICLLKHSEAMLFTMATQRGGFAEILPAFVQGTWWSLMNEKVTRSGDRNCITLGCL